MKVNNLNDTKQRWSLRKLSVGVCSVLLGMALLGASQTASADTTTVSPAQTTAVAVQPSAATNSQQATNVQNAMVPSDYANSLNGYRPGDTQSQTLRNASYEGKTANVKNANLPVSNVKMYQHNGGAWQVQYNIKYQSNSADQQEIVDPQNLTAAQEAQLTNFAAATINQIRQKVQAQPNGTKVSAGYLKTSPYATQVGSAIVHSAYDNYSGDGHNMQGVEAAAKSYGINAWVGENISGASQGLEAVQLKQGGYISNITMDMLKQEVYGTIIAMMYEDYNGGVGAGGHTTALLNDPEYNVNSSTGGNAIALDRNGNVIGNQYLALTLDRRNRIHFEFISDAGATTAAKNQLATNAVQVNGDGTAAANSNSDSNNGGTTTIANGWKTANGKWQYIENGTTVKNAWRAVRGSWYYFDNNGDALTDLQTVNGHVYDFAKTNANALTGWQKVNGSWYYFDPSNAWAITGWFKSGAGNWYYFGKDGKAASGLQTINGHVYDFDANNAWALTGWQKVDGSWYYFDNTNAWALTGWQWINGHWYYFAKDGKAASGLQTINGRVYDFDANNVWALTSWQKVNDSWYYFDPSNAWAITGWFKSGAGNWYYFGQDGKAVSGLQTVNGHVYDFDANNAWAQTGWQKVNGAWYYFDNTNAWALTGWQRINNRWYYFAKDGKAASGLQTINGHTYYFDPSNAWAVTGDHTINGKTYHFDAVNAWVTNA